MNAVKRLNRRQFMARSVAQGAALGLASPLLSLGAEAATLGGGGYRALVCVFLFGGNDGNNTVVPTDTAGYAAYAKARGTAGSGGLSLDRAQLQALSGTTFGLHPALAPLAQLWNQGQLAVQANVGTLVQPLTLAQYQASSQLRPPSLFSHIDQQTQWQLGASGLTLASGWGGRVADLQTASTVPTVLSFSGNAVFMNGAHSQGLALPAKGGFSIHGFGNTPATNPLFGLYNTLLKTPQPNLEVQAASDVIEQALLASNLLNPALSAAGSTAGLFAGQTSSLAQQLQAVAKLVEARNNLGVSRQIFFVSLGGFDTHNDQLNRQNALFQQLGPALKSFHDAMQQLGMGSSVTTYTASDFARTLQPASGAGSDHAWGNHHFIMGGAVKAGIYGAMPQLVLGGPNDVTSEGRWLPTTSVEQMGATLASWLGVGAGDLLQVFPHLANFPQRNMGYFG